MDKMIWPTLLDLAGCLESEFSGQEVCFLGVLHGQAAPWDYGLEGLMVWVRLAGAYPSTTFPAPSQEIGCAKPLAFDIEVGALRCAPVPDEVTGGLPTAADQRATAEDTTADMGLLYAAISCCFGRGAKRRFQDVVIGNYSPLGPLGGVTGGAWTLTVSQEG